MVIKKLKEVKAMFKSQGLWNQYKDFFPNKATRFVFTFFNDALEDVDLSVEELFELEKGMMAVAKPDQSMFVNSFNLFAKKMKKYKKLNFAPFANYFFFVWQASRYYRDKRRKIENVFTMGNYNVKNERKREYFYEWLRFLREINPDFNKIILKLRKKGI